MATTQLPVLGAAATAHAADTYVVNVVYDAGCVMWVAECDELHLITEDHSLEGLMDRVAAVAPDCIADNAIVTNDSLRFAFVVIRGGGPSVAH